MNWLATFFIALLTGGLSLFGSGMLASGCVRWYHVSSAEGYSGYFVVALSLLGAVTGFVVALVTCRVAIHHQPEISAPSALGYACGVVLLILAVLTIFCWAFGDKSPQELAYPTLDEIATERAEKVRLDEEREFSELSSDAPLSSWLPFAEREPQKARTLAALVSRPDLVEELRQLVLADEAQVAAQALRVIRLLPDRVCELDQIVALSGSDLVSRLQACVELSVEEDPGYEQAAMISLRFSAWIDAVRVVREKCEGDFTGELARILELSRKRPDSIVLHGDVRRVASYYLHQWAGIPPLPDDPPPR